MADIRLKIYNEVQSIKPFDALEKEHISDVLSWIESGAELFRIEKPDKPPKHLVSYFIFVDKCKQSILLVDHIKAQLWLPAGGHVEVNEAPLETVRREAVEELGENATFFNNYTSPFFITVTETVGLTAGHIDVSLWYLLEGNVNEVFSFSKEEFYTIKWFTLDDVLKTSAKQLDPHLHRFVQKLLAQKLLYI